MKGLKRKREYLAILLLIIYYIVGFVGFSIESLREMMVGLTPLSLLFTFILLTWVHYDILKSYLYSFTIVFLIGYWIEVAGVHTEVIFGSYEYGPTLGWKMFDVPLLMGFNWFILSITSKGIVSYLTKNVWVRVITAAILMVFTDFFIEPITDNLGFWFWEGDIIPVQNYIMWFITAVIIQLILSKTINRLNLTICLGVYLIQLLFFIYMNLIL